MNSQSGLLLVDVKAIITLYRCEWKIFTAENASKWVPKNNSERYLG